uniref:MULE transposase domain-containing protein n=1 Tax=Ditylenchus dipsaci TaxID=166011 RepID=A0A915D041_9BILA
MKCTPLKCTPSGKYELRATYFRKKQAYAKGFWWISVLENTFKGKPDILEVYLLSNWMDGTANTKCGGKGLTCDGNFELTSAHHHYGDENRVEAKRFQGIVQKQALSSKELPRRVIGNALNKISKQAWGHIRRSFVANNIRNIRHENKLEPANPKNLQSLEVPKDFQMYQDEVFLKFDGWNGAQRVLIFSTNKFLDLLVAEKNIGADGTWGVVPLLFDNLWIIYARLAHTFVPVVFSLLTDRKTETYEFVLKKLVELRPDLSPTSIAVDFELGEFNAFKKVWSEIQMRGCFVHLQRSMIRNVYEKGNKSLYDSNSMFRLEVNMILALAFVPVNDVGVALDDLRTKVEGYQHGKELEPLIDYFEDNYVGRPTAGGVHTGEIYSGWNLPPPDARKKICDFKTLKFRAKTNFVDEFVC